MQHKLQQMYMKVVSIGMHMEEMDQQNYSVKMKNGQNMIIRNDGLYVRNLPECCSGYDVGNSVTVYCDNSASHRVFLFNRENEVTIHSLKKACTSMKGIINVLQACACQKSPQPCTVFLHTAVLVHQSRLFYFCDKFPGTYV